MAIFKSSFIRLPTACKKKMLMNNLNVLLIYVTIYMLSLLLITICMHIGLGAYWVTEHQRLETSRVTTQNSAAKL